MRPNTDIVSYYARRAREYERIYQKPERQADLRRLSSLITEELAGHDVLEVACGTGFWTQRISRTAHSVLATDIGDEVLSIARLKDYPNDNVLFRKAGAFTLDGIVESSSAGLAAFWWSHIPVLRIPEFLSTFHARLRPGALVVVADNNYVAESNTPVSRVDEDGNSYQHRVLEDGSTHEVIKNFPDENALRAAVRSFADDVRYTSIGYYWCLIYRLKGTGPRP